VILPEATLGVLGGGQLGRMFTVAARKMGYRVIVMDPDPRSPAADFASEHLQREYTDSDALDYLGSHCAAVTTEFENVPVAALRVLETQCVVRPGAAAVEKTQDRIREKTFIRDCGLATAPFYPVTEAADLDAALERIQLPALLKTATLGYDGKGQRTVSEPAQAHAAWAEMGKVPCVLEERVDLRMELSVLLARSSQSQIESYPVAENVHVHGILDTSIVPARVDADVAERVDRMARTLADRLDYCGVMAVEFFLTADSQLLINEIAPRPHNSGHYTLDACVTDQFEQQVRVLCGLPPGDASLLSPAVMVNLLGDLWQDGVPAWDKCLQHSNVKLHLYGKRQARAGRKMGHFNVISANVDQALQIAKETRQQLDRA
jgi:5-(carboxyamino)imidazole ribonucleotide synthase